MNLQFDNTIRKLKLMLNPAWLKNRLFNELPKEARGYWKQGKQNLSNIWRKAIPNIDKLSDTTSAITTTTSMLHSSFQLFPVLLSILTFVTSATLLHSILPPFIFNPNVVIGALVITSIYAGYSKYRELIHRSKLDLQILVNERENKKLKNKVQLLENHLKQIGHPLPTKESLVTPAFHKAKPLNTKQKPNDILQPSRYLQHNAQARRLRINTSRSI